MCYCSQVSFEHYFGDYADAFNRFDAVGIASFFHCPCVMVSNQGATVLSTPDAIHANTEALLAFHREHDFGRALVCDLQTRSLASNLAVVEAGWQVERVDGSVLWTFRNTYNLGDFGGGWRILASTTHAE